MDKHPITIINRLCVAAAALVLITNANANLLTNPGFETGAASNDDQNAQGWTQFNNAFRTGTNTSLFGITAHNSAYSMKTFQPFATNFNNSGAYQSFSTTAGQLWRFNGYVLNWQNDAFRGPDGYGIANLIFLDNTGTNVLQTSSTPRYGIDVPIPLDTWQTFEVDAVAPAGTATVRAQVNAFGAGADTGSLWWDDVNLYQPTASNTASVGTAPAVQVTWPTSAPTNGVHYQIQSTTSLVFSNNAATSALLTNAGFEIGAVSNAPNNATTPSGWVAQNGGFSISSYPNPTHSGIGALRLSATTAVPVVYQGNPSSPNPVPATPGQVWTFTGFSYMSSTDGPIPNGNNTFALLKIVWNDASGVKVDPLTSDTNAVGTIVTGANGGIESTHVTFSTPLNQWIPMTCAGTVPPGAAFVQVFEILVGQGSPGGTVRFDDVALQLGASHNGWQNLGPTYPATGNPISIMDTQGTNKSKFYRVTTP